MTDVLETQRDTEADYLSMESQRDKLVEIMESEFGLPEKLLKMRALSHRQVDKIRYAVAREEKNEMILDFILQSGKQQDLMKALSESFQTHLVNYINSNGVYRSEFGLDWPLTEREHEILNDNEEQLTDILDTCELVPKLYSKQVINLKQRNFISSRTSDQARNEALLGMIRRLSRASYFTLIQCLKDSHQMHIADILENGGVVLRVHATLETDNLDETETQIANEFTDLLMQRNASSEQAIRAFNAAQLNIIAIKRGQSIVIYICCSTEDELDRVCKMIDNSEMKTFLQQLFDLLTHNINFTVLLVKIYKSDVNKAKQIFQRMKELKNKGTECDSAFASKEDSTPSISFGRNRPIIVAERQQNMASPTQSSDRYNMGSPFRGLFIIINNEIFQNAPRRKGTEKDAVRLKATFEQLGFEVKVFDNKKSIEMLQIMADANDLSYDYDCLGVAILTHGNENKIYGVGENDVCSLDTVLGPWKDTKKEIPKLVLIQACCGNNLDAGHVVREDLDTSSKAEDKAIRVPLESDFLYHFSTSPGYYSFRNSVIGSVFIQKLCDVFDEHIKANVEIDVVKSMIQVNRRVAEDYESYITNPKDKALHRKKQMPSFVCMLRKELFFKKQT